MPQTLLPGDALGFEQGNQAGKYWNLVSGLLLTSGGNMHERILNLSEIQILKAISNEDLIELLNSSTTNKYTGRSIIYETGDPARFVYMIKKGKVKLFINSECGKEIIIGIIEAGDTFGFGPIYGQHKKPCSAAALMDTILCVIPYVIFESLIKRNSLIGLEIIRSMGSRIHYFQCVIEDLLTKNLQSRLAKVLLELSDKSGFSSPSQRMSSPQEGIMFSHEELGNLISGSRQKVTTALNIFENQGLIKKARKMIIVLERERLQALI